ncbi:hypothetical protein IEQ34_009200 [Dendrobium chrysotoxum]|uniref:Uncharacterized protein n=1 Tax=Dendrobium chrysotoxum TaxID=161865 RepID=A0AAV7GIH4_DENCH|nr:hypothetical protein IEQ34_009200 [Dendrobium chrysotoxum]
MDEKWKLSKNKSSRNSASRRESSTSASTSASTSTSGDGSAAYLKRSSSMPAARAAATAAATAGGLIFCAILLQPEVLGIDLEFSWHHIKAPSLPVCFYLALDISDVVSFCDLENHVVAIVIDLFVEWPIDVGCLSIVFYCHYFYCSFGFICCISPSWGRSCCNALAIFCLCLEVSFGVAYIEWGGIVFNYWVQIILLAFGFRIEHWEAFIWL